VPFFYSPVGDQPPDKVHRPQFARQSRVEAIFVDPVLDIHRRLRDRLAPQGVDRDDQNIVGQFGPIERKHRRHPRVGAKIAQPHHIGQKPVNAAARGFTPAL
jgi:hypothetical protein